MPGVITSIERPARNRGRRSARARLLVHVGLLATVAGTLGTLQLLHIRNAIHADVGLGFASLVIIHLAQRRHRIARLFGQLKRLRGAVLRELRLLASDAVLALLAANVIVSGIIDWDRGYPTPLPLPRPFDRWHLLSSVLLVLYVLAHVSRRRKRLKRSAIR